jgi:hypothetical protein
VSAERIGCLKACIVTVYSSHVDSARCIEGYRGEFVVRAG